jgi:Lysyl oxidase
MLRNALISVSPFILSLVIGCGEPPLAACGDGVDSDGDVFIDAADPGCDSPEDNDETDPQCLDGIDNDFDGLVDAADPECADPASNAEANLAAIPELRMTADINQVQAQTRTVQGVDANNAEFIAGCFKGTGDRDILEWNSVIENHGTADLVVGNTDDHQPVWTIAEGFDRLEFFGWTRSQLFDAQRNVVGTGHKGSFCMIDLTAPIPGVPNDGPQFGDCGNGQGISNGFGDVYSIGLECQFIDITGVPAGSYTLQVETNFTKQLPESNYNNNIEEYPVTIP